MTDSEIVDFLERHNFTFDRTERGCTLHMRSMGNKNGIRVHGTTLRDSVEALHEPLSDETTGDTDA